MINRNNKYHKYKHISSSLKFRTTQIPSIPYETISSNERPIVFLIKVTRSRYRNKVVSGRLVSKYPLTLDERIKEARKKLAKMSMAKKWELVRKGYGMWEDYPEDWLERLREGTLFFNHMRETSDINYVLSS